MKRQLLKTVKTPFRDISRSDCIDNIIEDTLHMNTFANGMRMVNCVVHMLQQILPKLTIRAYLINASESLAGI